MRIAELIELIGRQGTIELSGLTIKVQIVDIKESYGHIRYLVTPLSGSGEIWIENIRINEVRLQTPAPKIQVK